MKTERDGTVIIDNTQVKVNYHFVSDDEIFCTVTEQIKSYQIGYQFYTHYKSLKH